MCEDLLSLYFIFFCSTIISSEYHLQGEGRPLLPDTSPTFHDERPPTYLEPEYWSEKFFPHSQTIEPCSLKRCGLRVGAMLSWPFTLIACFAAGCIKGASESCEVYRVEKEEAAKYLDKNKSVCQQCCAECNYTLIPVCAFCLHPCMESCEHGCNCCVLSFTTILCDDCAGSTLNHNVHH